LIGSAEADVDLDLGDTRDSRVVVRASEVDSGTLQFDRVELRASGRTGEHELSFEAASPGDERYRLAGFEARIAARGAFEIEGRRWHGDLASAQLSFPDGSVTLLQPAALDLSPAAMSAAPICLETGESRFCAEGQWTARPESWRLIYSAQDWPLKRLLTSLLGWREFDGCSRRAAGSARNRARTGSAPLRYCSIRRASTYRATSSAPSACTSGGGRLDLFAEQDHIRADLDLSVGENARIEGEARAERVAGAPWAEFPVKGRLHGGSEALTALPLFVPEIDRSAGRLDAQVTMNGTLGEPLFNGEFAVTDGRFEFYRTQFHPRRCAALGPLRGR
jgi:autotransporter translocation and assembly factor TamB